MGLVKKLSDKFGSSAHPTAWRRTEAGLYGVGAGMTAIAGVSLLATMPPVGVFGLVLAAVNGVAAVDRARNNTKLSEKLIYPVLFPVFDGIEAVAHKIRPPKPKQ